MEENRLFVEKFNFPFTLLCDTKREMGVAYAACKSASDKHASRIGYIIGADGKIKNAYPSVDARNFPETALNDV